MSRRRAQRRAASRQASPKESVTASTSIGKTSDTWKIDLKTVVAIAALLVSGGSMATAARGCSRSDEALRIARLEFEARIRTTILLNQSEDQYLFEPSNPEAKFATLKLIYPRAIHDRDNLLLDFNMDVADLNSAMESFYLPKLPDPAGTWMATLPLGVEVAYTSKMAQAIECQLYFVRIIFKQGKVADLTWTYVGTYKDTIVLREALEFRFAQSKVTSMKLRSSMTSP